jgi:hypothetical protein
MALLLLDASPHEGRIVGVPQNDPKETLTAELDSAIATHDDASGPSGRPSWSAIDDRLQRWLASLSENAPQKFLGNEISIDFSVKLGSLGRVPLSVTKFSLGLGVSSIDTRRSAG